MDVTIKFSLEKDVLDRGISELNCIKFEEQGRSLLLLNRETGHTQ